MNRSYAHLHGLTIQSPIRHGHSMLGDWGTVSKGCDPPKGSRFCPHPAVQKSWCSRVGKSGWMKQLTGRAILFGVCIQSCQFRFPFHLLNQELCRSKCQAGFKAADCRAPGCDHTATPSCLLSGSSHCRHWSSFSPNPLIPLKISDGHLCPLTTQAASGSKMQLLISEMEVILPGETAEAFLLVAWILLKGSLQK